MTYEDIRKANEAADAIAYERRNKKTGETESNPYVPVNQRVKAFRMLYPDNGFIETSIESLENGVVLFRAEAGYYEDSRRVVLGIGHCMEKEGSSYINQTSYIENAETGAVGRALGMLGIGIDAAFASEEEVANAKLQQNDLKTLTDRDVKALTARCEHDGYDASILPLLYGVNDLSEINMKMMAHMNAAWEKDFFKTAMVIAKKCLDDKVPIDKVCAAYKVPNLASLTKTACNKIIGSWDELK